MLVLKKLIENELKAANTKFPPFNSRHEAYGVLKEEYEEIKEEIDDIGIGILKDYWKLCRKLKNKNQVAPGLIDKGYYSTYGDKEAKKLLDNLEAAINCSFKELLQLGAMVQKAKKLEEINENKISCFDTCKHYGTSMCAYPERCKSY